MFFFSFCENMTVNIQKKIFFRREKNMDEHVCVYVFVWVWQKESVPIEISVWFLRVLDKNQNFILRQTNWPGKISA